MADSGSGQPLFDFRRWRSLLLFGVIATLGAVVPNRALAEDAVKISPSSMEYVVDVHVISRQHLRQLDAVRQLRHTACGPLAILAILDRADVRLEPELVRKILAYAAKGYVSLRDLEAIASEAGLLSYGVVATVDDLQEWGLFAVALFDGYQFVAVTGYDDRRLEVVEPLATARLVDKGTFEQRFGLRGHALILSRKRHPELEAMQRHPDTDQPRVVIEGPLEAVGLTESADWQASLRVSNGSARSTTITAHAATEGVAITPDEFVVQSDGETVIKVQGRANERGPFQSRVEFRLEESSELLDSVTVRGYFAPPRVTTIEAIRVEGVREGDGLIGKIPLLGEVSHTTVVKGTKGRVVTDTNGAHVVFEIRDIQYDASGWYHARVELFREEDEARLASIPIAISKQ